MTCSVLIQFACVNQLCKSKKCENESTIVLNTLRHAIACITSSKIMSTTKTADFRVVGNGRQTMSSMYVHCACDSHVM